MNKTIVTKFASLLVGVGLAGITGFSSVYVTGFTDFVLNTDFHKDFSVAFGGIDPGANVKLVDSGEWGITTNGNDFAGGIARPQNNPATNVKMAGLFLNPGLFSGAGTYSVSFDLTGNPGGNAAYRAYVFTGSGYDLTGAEDKRLTLSLSAGGFGTYTGLSATGTGVSASQLVMVDLSTAATTAGVTPVAFDFTYDGTSAIAIAIGGYNNASTIDDFSVVPEPATFALLAGMATLGLALYRRRK